MNSCLNLLRAEPRNYLFRELPQNILIGTASGRYAGWIGQDRKRRMEHRVRTTQPGILYMRELVDIATAAAEAWFAVFPSELVDLSASSLPSG